RRAMRTAVFFVFPAEDGIRGFHVTGVQTCALPISCGFARRLRPRPVSRGGPRGSWYGKQSEPNQTDLETTTPIFLPTPFTRVSSSGSNKVLKAHDTIAKTARNGHHCNISLL